MVSRLLHLLIGRHPDHRRGAALGERLRPMLAEIKKNLRSKRYVA
jgi:hypothetical protein